jgi:hypothetical protein
VLLEEARHAADGEHRGAGVLLGEERVDDGAGARDVLVVEGGDGLLQLGEVREGAVARGSSTLSPTLPLTRGRENNGARGGGREDVGALAARWRGEGNNVCLALGEGVLERRELKSVSLPLGGGGLGRGSSCNDRRELRRARDGHRGSDEEPEDDRDPAPHFTSSS